MNSPIMLLICLLSSILVDAGENNSSTDYSMTSDISPKVNHTVPHIVIDNCDTGVENLQEVDEFIRNITIQEEEFDNELNDFIDNLHILQSEEETMCEECILKLQKLLPKHLNLAQNLIDDIKEFGSYTVCNTTLGNLTKFTKVTQLRNFLDLVVSVLNNFNSNINYSDVFSAAKKEIVNKIIEFYKTWQSAKKLVKQHELVPLISREEMPLEELKEIIVHRRKTVETVSQIIECMNDLKNIFEQIGILSIIGDNIQEWEMNRILMEDDVRLTESIYNRQAIVVSLDFLKDKVEPIILGVLFVIGTLENGVLILVFILNKDMRTATNFSVINLTIADIFSLSVNAFLFIFQLKENWTLGNKLCKLYLFCEDFGIVLSIYSVVLVSFQRFLAVTNIYQCDVSKHILLKKIAPFAPIAIVWIISAGLASLFVLLYVEDKYIAENRFCYVARVKYVEIVSVSQLVFFCIVPLVIIIGTSIITSYRIRNSITNIPGEAQGLKTVIKARALSSRIVLGLTLVFIVSYFPYFLNDLCTRLLFLTDPDFDSDILIFKSLHALVLTRAMIFLNSCFNPIALYLMSRNYRMHMNKVLSCGLTSRISKTRRPQTGHQQISLSQSSSKADELCQVCY